MRIEDEEGEQEKVRKIERDRKRKLASFVRLIFPSVIIQPPILYLLNKKINSVKSVFL